MASNLFDANSNDLENQIEDISNYLEKLLKFDGGENEHSPDRQVIETNNLNQQAHQANKKEQRYIPFMANTPSTNYLVQSNVNASPSQSNTFPMKSALASYSTTSNSASTSGPQQKPKKFTHLKHKDTESDFSSIDIDATMKELGITTESFTGTEVFKLFSLYGGLEFSIHAEIISTSIYDENTLPKTANVSTQTKHAVWSSQKLLRDLNKTLKRPMPAEYKPAFNKCQEALGELQHAIVTVNSFRHCRLEHRKGEFISHETKEYLQPLMDALNHLIKCVEKARAYVQVYDRALNAPEIYRAAILSTSDGKPQPKPEESYTEAPSTSRAIVARRYIG